MKNISIMEGSMLNITCNVILGIPKAATFKWTRQKDSFITESQVLMIENISRGSSSTYTCTVTNIMKPTIGIQEKGESSGSLEIDVLCKLHIIKYAATCRCFIYTYTNPHSLCKLMECFANQFPQ
jgi:hypothetical protein